MTLRPEPAPAAAATSETGSEKLVGKRVHKYEIVRVIGRGGMGTVYEAVNTDINKRVAMKFIDAGTSGAASPNAETAARFQREAQAASAVESAHIVEIFDSGISEEGQPYIVMELLRGEDLGHRIKRCGRLEAPEALHVTGQILRGLNRAHKAGIVHRDLKPDNIFLVDRDDDPNFAKILDFGISKVRRGGETPVHTLTRQGTVLGTPFYMSPEQAQAQPDVDSRSDLWSVGAILYECLTGRPPYTGATYEQVIVNICMNDADDVRLYNPAVPEPVADVIAKALSRDREDRFQEAREFLEALRHAAGSAMASRADAMNDDSFPGLLSSSNPALSPVSSRRAPSRPNGAGSRRRFPSSSDGAFDATVQFQSSPPAELKRSPEERRRLAAQKQRRTFALVAISALLTGGLGAFFAVRTMARPPAPIAGAGTAAPTLTSIVTAQVNASAAPIDPPTSGTGSAAPIATPPADSGEPRRTPTAKPNPTPAPTLRPTAKPADTGAPAASGSGVASGLKLKTD